MTEYVVTGGTPLGGSIQVQGSKNAALPVLAAMATSDICVDISNCPSISDVKHTLQVLRMCGRQVEERAGTIRFTDCITETDISFPEICCMRSGILFAGAVLGNLGKVRICSPGGCDIGPRPIDLHLKAFESLGGRVKTEGDGIISIDGSRMAGSSLWLDYPSVGATENVMLCAVNIPGFTEIHNAAREPEIEELQWVLNSMGFTVEGAGTSVICIKGGRHSEVDYAEYNIEADRIVAGTYLTAIAATGGRGTVTGVSPDKLSSITDILERTGCTVETEGNSISVFTHGRLKRVRNITSGPYPGFPTDMQPQVMAMLASADGTSVIRETVFENRFRHVDELNRMGADILVRGDTAIVNGVPLLRGASVRATDLRSGAALVIAGLTADTQTRVCDNGCIDRGYADICGDLRALGANIYRLDDEDEMETQH
ncbi:MAG: UDP-N-acetylglucosamine 1-carboxyvinyltransferase [Clostridia bacterium]|nr:UDP-N-acetylglucosamine 1-carboxyvinyltransferase [Clostridia bacterium]